MVKSNAQPGDYVEVHMTRKIYEGVLLESSEDEKGIVLLKLNSGYNIGLIKKDVSEIKLIKKGKDVKQEESVKKDPKKPNIGMIITGGTIASKLDPKTGGVKWLTDPNTLFKYYPEIFEKVNVAHVEVPFMKASEDMNYKDWQKIAKVCEKMLNDSNIKGVVITHGTDFLHYTSAALSFMLKDLNKPVVLTYSQRSIDRASSDANLNLRCAALAAISDLCEVMLVGHSSTNDDFCYALKGTKVKKLHSSKRDAFKAVNEKPVAKIYSAPLGVPQGSEKGGNKIEYLNHNKVRNKNKVLLDNKFEEKVALLKFYPGMEPSILDYYIKNKYKGIVIEMTGLGHVCVSGKNSWTKKLKEVIDKGLVVCAAAQTVYGRLDPLVYSNGRELMKTGVIYLGDMLAETAFVKLGWALGHADWDVKEKMLENVAGEFNDRIEE